MVSPVSKLIHDLPSPANISYLWNFGSLLGVFLGIQILTGLILSMHYSGDLNLAFFSVENVSREISYGIFIRFLHVGGARAYFMFLYLHIFRGLWKLSFFRKKKVWLRGCTILLLSMATAFLGYVLPWGQMSFWGATVITNFFSVIPYIGTEFVRWLWGGFSVKNPTLTRFYSLHFFTPFIILGVIILHVVFLHEKGSSNPQRVQISEKIPFFPFFSKKDVLGFVVGCFLAYLLMFGLPFSVLEEQNFLKAKFLVTPEHIQPEWYFLAAYAVLRAVPKKLGGVLSLVAFVLIFYLIPFFFRKKNKSTDNKPYYKTGLILWRVKIFFLTWLGAQPVEDPYILMTQIGYFFYFIFFILMFVLKI